FIVPVVDYVLKNVCVSVPWYLLEEVATDRYASRLQSCCGDLGARLFCRVGQIEDDAIELRVGFKNSDKQRPVASAYIDQLPDRRKIIRCSDRGGGHRRKGCHGLIEHLRLFGIGCDAAERIRFGRLAAKPRLAGANAILKFLPRILNTGSREE